MLVHIVFFLNHSAMERVKLYMTKEIVTPIQPVDVITDGVTHLWLVRRTHAFVNHRKKIVPAT